VLGLWELVLTAHQVHLFYTHPILPLDMNTTGYLKVSFPEIPGTDKSIPREEEWVKSLTTLEISATLISKWPSRTKNSEAELRK
jgi:hypothetical protein